jgi:hypothetical protein
MLKSKTVAKLIETTLNYSEDEKFRVVYGAGSYKGAEINCILKQGKGTTTPIANYTNVNTPFTLEVIVPMQCGEDRVDTIVDAINDMIKTLNGKIRNDIDGGKAVFLFSPLEIGSYETRATTGQSVIIRVDFSVEYSTNVGTKYEMALITNEFVGTIDTPYFENQTKQVEWFEGKIKQSNAQFNEVLTPNANSLVITSQRYLNTGNSDVNELLMYNYAIIKETKPDTSVNYYYYEITNAVIGQYNLLTLDLKMDTLQTWYFNPNIEFGECYISKADINRWIDNGDGTVSFDTRVESELFEREDIKNCTKRLKSREVVNQFNEVLYGGINNWLNENVIGWYYVFVSSNAMIRVPNSSYKEDTTSIGKAKLKPIVYKNKEIKEDVPLNQVVDNSFYNTIVCCAFPLMRTTKKIYFAEVEEQKNNDGSVTGYSISNKLEISNKSLEYFLNDLGADYVYSMKFSQVPPFKYVSGLFIDVNNNITTEKDGDLVLKGEVKEEKFTYNNQEYTYNTLAPLYLSYGNEVEAVNNYGILQNGIDKNYGLLNVLGQVNININMFYNLKDIEFTFKKTDIVDADHNLKYNPKLLSSDYIGLVLSDNLQNGAEYDILKLGKNNLTITYTEALTPDITKRYIRLSNLNGYYVPEISDNLTGYVVTDDTSFTIESSQYKSMIANNKNFFLQNSINREQPYKTNIATGVANTATSAILGLMAGGTIGAVVGAGVGLGSSIYSASKNKELDKTNDLLNVDNLKNAPNSINGAKGNIIFNAMYSNLGVIVELHDILPNEKKMVDDRINLYGMTLNKITNIKNYDNIRRYHNYIEADIQGIKGISLSNVIQDDIRQRFANGIRFWNADDNGNYNVSYVKENYERWLKA